MSKITQQKRNGLYELTAEAKAELAGSKYYNEDLAPTTIEQRNWSTSSITNLWIGMSICIPSLSLSASLIGLGVSPMLSVLNVILGNLIVLIPMQLNSQIGTKYGIPFPIFARMTFGNKGTQLPTIARAIVACGWNSVMSWVGGGAIAAIVGIAIPSMVDPNNIVAMPGNPSVQVGQLIGFFLFMIVVFWVAYNGLDQVKWVQDIGGPVLVTVIVLLGYWSIDMLKDGGFTIAQAMFIGNDWALLEANGGFAFVYLAGLTANISFWSTMALNIPDFSRYAASQKSQFRGQLYGMPAPMALCAVVGALFGMSTKLTLGTAMFDPTGLFYYVDNNLLVVIASLGVMMATITTCVAANVVAPANGFSNISPSKISYRKGVVITILISVVVMQPWFIYGTGASFIFNWLNNYGAILAPLAAILIADYFFVKKQLIDVAGLYNGKGGRYWYSNGINWNGMIAWACSFPIPLIWNTVLAWNGEGTPGFMHYIAANGYVFSFFVGMIVYILLMKRKEGQFGYGFVSQAEYDAMTVE